MTNYKLTIEVDNIWMSILNQISKNQEGFIWHKVKEVK